MMAWDPEHNPEQKKQLEEWRAQARRVEERLRGPDGTWPPMRYVGGLQHAMGNAAMVAAIRLQMGKAEDERRYFYHAGRCDALLFAMGEPIPTFEDREKAWNERKVKK